LQPRAVTYNLESGPPKIIPAKFTAIFVLVVSAKNVSM
jgi:hypothetical protein